MNKGKSTFNNRNNNGGGLANNRSNAIGGRGSSKILQRNNIISNNKDTPDLNKNKGKAIGIGSSLAEENHMSSG